MLWQAVSNPTAAPFLSTTKEPESPASAKGVSKDLLVRTTKALVSMYNFPEAVARWYVMVWRAISFNRPWVALVVRPSLWTTNGSSPSAVLSCSSISAVMRRKS